MARLGQACPGGRKDSWQRKKLKPRLLHASECFESSVSAEHELLGKKGAVEEISAPLLEGQGAIPSFLS